MSVNPWRSPFGTHLPDQTRQVRKRTTDTGSMERWAESGMGHLPKYGRNGISRRIKSHRKNRNTQDRNDSSHAECCVKHPCIKNNQEEQRKSFHENQSLKREVVRPSSQRRHHRTSARARNLVYQAPKSLPRRMPTTTMCTAWSQHEAAKPQRHPVWR
jgi:hypothetical protein